MLKIVKTSLAVAAASFIFSGTAQAGVEDALANICTIVQANDKGELRKKMRDVQSDYRLKLHDYYGGVSCNGKSLIRTAIESNAVDVGLVAGEGVSRTLLAGVPNLRSGVTRSRHEHVRIFRVQRQRHGIAGVV